MQVVKFLGTIALVLLAIGFIAGWNDGVHSSEYTGKRPASGVSRMLAM